MRKLLWCLAILGFMAAACRPGTLTEAGLKEYAMNSENGLIQETSDGNVLFELAYRPKDLVVLQEANSSDSLEWEKVASRLVGYDYFTLRISKNNRPIEESFQASSGDRQRVVEYFSNRIESNVSLQKGDKVIKPEAVLYSQGFGSVTSSNVLVVFKGNLEEEMASAVSINLDAEEIGLGRHTFKYRLIDLRHIPSLKRQ